MIKIKICGITRPQDGLAVAAAGADALGLMFYDKSPRYVSIEQAQTIVQVLPPFISTVGLFVNPSVEYVQKILAAVPLSCLQFHGQETDEFCQQFRKPYLKAIHVGEDSNIETMISQYPNASGILLDTYVKGVSGGTGVAFDWQVIPRSLTKPLILAGGLTPGNVADAIHMVKPYAVDVSSGVESAPGIKSAEKVKQFCEQVRTCQ
jgi:phosphoribosylanthranilate isomerase